MNELFLRYKNYKREQKINNTVKKLLLAENLKDKMFLDNIEIKERLRIARSFNKR